MAQDNQNNDNALTNLIINYLPQSVTEKDLFDLFVSIGPIKSCRIMKDMKTGYSYGFGFVNYAREQDADTAIKQFNGFQVKNKKLKVSYARPSGEDIKDTNLYITNLPRAITDEQLEELFGKFGNIVQKSILKDKITGLPRGVAFVRYSKRPEAMEAMQKMNGTTVEGSMEPLHIKVAEDHGKHKAAYYAGFHAGCVQSRGAGPMKKPYETPPYSPIPPLTPVRPYQTPGALSPVRPYQTPGALPPVRPYQTPGALRQDRSYHRYNPMGTHPLV